MLQGKLHFIAAYEWKVISDSILFFSESIPSGNGGLYAFVGVPYSPPIYELNVNVIVTTTDSSIIGHGDKWNLPSEARAYPLSIHCTPNKVLDFFIPYFVHYRVIFDRDISRVYIMMNNRLLPFLFVCGYVYAVNKKKNREYVYGIWQYKIQSIKYLFQCFRVKSFERKMVGR